MAPDLRSRPVTADAAPIDEPGPASLAAEVAALRDLVTRQQALLEAQSERIAELRGYETHWHLLRSSPSWQLIMTLQNLRTAALPAGSRRERWLATAASSRREGVGVATRQLADLTGRWARRRRSRLAAEPAPAVQGTIIEIAPVTAGPDQPPGQDTADPRLLAAEAPRVAVRGERDAWVHAGQSRFAGRRVLFLVPLAEQGGGANVVIREGRAMRRMGVEVALFNLTSFQESFAAGYPDLDLPVVYGQADDVAAAAEGFDAVVATACGSVSMLPAASGARRQAYGYYIQDFEPYFFAPGSERNAQAWASYTARPDLIRFCKSDWNRQEVLRRTGAASTAVGPSLDLDLFRPRPRRDPAWPQRAVRVAAMVRPGSTVRQPARTMRVMREIDRAYGGSVEIVLFGVRPDDPSFLDLPRDFAWQLAGLLSPRQVAALFNEVDVFADLSQYQALGLSALEAMGCGVAVVAPTYGGAGEFIQHRANGLLTDTASLPDMVHAVRLLVESPDLRQHLGQAAIRDVCQYYPEAPAYRILEALFGAAGP